MPPSQSKHTACSLPLKKHSSLPNAALSYHSFSPGYLYTDSSCAAVPHITAHQVGDISAHKSSGSCPCCSRNFVNRDKDEDESGAQKMCPGSTCTLQVLINRMNDTAEKYPYIQSSNMTVYRYQKVPCPMMNERAMQHLDQKGPL